MKTPVYIMFFKLDLSLFFVKLISLLKGQGWSLSSDSGGLLL